ncbi:MAG TPA: SDR family NAD(P)-dependent oxidoreductase, partial [Steroidobacteraceae bacterium]|nr:SDR family NAD(P)-dependent oxidoreductase [Steroidobacteraceae bacterium]
MDDARVSGAAASRVAVVTGAGSATGIGFAIARALGHTGLRVLIASTTDRVHERAADLRREGMESTGVACDLTTETGVAALVAAAQSGAT